MATASLAAPRHERSVTPSATKPSVASGSKAEATAPAGHAPKAPEPSVSGRRVASAPKTPKPSAAQREQKRERRRQAKRQRQDERRRVAQERNKKPQPRRESAARPAASPKPAPRATASPPPAAPTTQLERSRALPKHRAGASRAQALPAAVPAAVEVRRPPSRLFQGVIGLVIALVVGAVLWRLLH